MSPRQAKNSPPVHSRISVPQKYHRQPVISRLVSRYGLTVNITAASLVSDNDSDGWFDLELSGNPQHLTNSLSYLQELGVNLVQIAIANQIQINRRDLAGNPMKWELGEGEKNLVPNHETTFLRSRSRKITGLSEEYQKWLSHGQTNRLRLQLCILQSYHQKPVISQLVSRYGLTVNIIGARLHPNMQDDGWFELDLWGKTKQIRSSLIYLTKLGLPIWLDWARG
ncbi:NIL domain-containing protein [Calothrix sp. FACHB-1219]|uniref:NIL domain-containing protein n=1 Tax=unclassified Calothrix TaxID=2619626 RepID=UPI001685EFF4|nr:MULTISPECIES: NIL domain-containing protein [unclassified Calothrix]MBD2205303.1 NIL domain-containing protein [Calothrix sp. FACHB-168]MBD2220076.1 NIL domain-containing protein [Calothrix sp. FACHB-1219]